MATQTTSGKKRDVSTLPTLAGIVGCILFAYGFSKENVLIQWVIPPVLIVAALAYSLWPATRRKRADPSP